MSDFSDLKHEILEWATSNVAMKEFTTHDVYDQVHSALSSEQTSDALRRLYKEGKLNRKEFMDGNRKKFIYSLADVKVDNKPQHKHLGGSSNPGSMQGITGTEPSESEFVDIDLDVNEIIDAYEKSKDMQKQIEIPNNFTIELRTPSGFVITIKSSDLKENK